MPVDQLLGIKELAELLKVTRGTLRNWRYQGRGPKSFQMNNGQVRYRQSEVQRWIEEQEAKQQ